MRLGGLIPLFSIAAAAALAAPAQADVTVNVANNAYTPSTVTIFEGDVVNWHFSGADKNHTVTSDAPNDQPGSFDSDPARTGFAPPGGKFSKEFTSKGEFGYFCRIHSFMRGKVIVRDRTNNPVPPPVDAAPPKLSSRRFSLRKRRFTFRLNEPAAITARLRGPTRRTRRFDGKVGRNTVKLPKRMKPGRYALTIVAVDEVDNVRRYTRRFRVPRR